MMVLFGLFCKTVILLKFKQVDIATEPVID